MVMANGLLEAQAYRMDKRGLPRKQNSVWCTRKDLVMDMVALLKDIFVLLLHYLNHLPGDAEQETPPSNNEPCCCNLWELSSGMTGASSSLGDDITPLL